MVPLGKAGREHQLMLTYPPYQIIRYPDVQHAAVACHDVHRVELLAHSLAADPYAYLAD